MSKGGFNCQTTCETCASGAIESGMHLFFECTKAVGIWNKMSEILGVQLMQRGDTIQQTWMRSFTREVGV